MVYQCWINQIEMQENYFNYLVYSWMGIAFIVFPVLLKITAPYGRHSVSGWGPLINNRLSWFLMELPALGIFVLLSMKRDFSFHPVIFIAVFLWCFHYFHRVFIFPLRIRTKGKKMPVVIMIFALFFNLINGSVNGYWFGVLSGGYPEDWFSDPRFIAGSILFAGGFIINLYHDRILIRLRKEGNGYKIPFGGLFRFVSCPNFLGEMIEWGGFALMSWCLPTLSFFIWTIVNLIPRAIDHHKWYKKNFNDYPAKRKAVVPFIL
jgi:3-oxo-5-alpha-steroid 4-dehydrogenase 1